MTGIKNLCIINNCNNCIQLFNDNVVCPRCDGNVLVYKALLEQFNQEILMCDECDAIWFSVDDVLNKQFIDFTTYVRSRGLSYEESNVINIDYL
jgi:hypothetical protein